MAHRASLWNVTQEFSGRKKKWKKGAVQTMGEVKKMEELKAGVWDGKGVLNRFA